MRFIVKCDTVNRLINGLYTIFLTKLTQKNYQTFISEIKYESYYLYLTLTSKTYQTAWNGDIGKKMYMKILINCKVY